MSWSTSAWASGVGSNWGRPDATPRVLDSCDGEGTREGPGVGSGWGVSTYILVPGDISR